ncbi:pilus assembly protein PilM [Candidatus Omnitrophota bacterium]
MAEAHKKKGIFTLIKKEAKEIGITEMLRFLTREAAEFISVDFGKNFIKIAHIRSKGDAIAILHYDVKKVLIDYRDSQEVVSFVRSFLDTHSISTREAYLTLSCLDSIVIKHLELPVVSREEVLAAAQWQFKEEDSFRIEDALCDWQVTKEYTDPEGAKKNEIIFVAAKAEIIKQYLAIMAQCNLFTRRISLAPFNYASILAYSQEDIPLFAVLDIGYDHTSLSVFKEKKLSFVRELSFSSHKVIQSLTGTLAAEKGRLNISYEEAKQIKDTYGIPQDENMLLKEGIRAIQIISLIRPLLEAVVRDIRNSFNYFTSYFREQKPPVLFITGEGADLKNLEGYLQRDLGITVSQLPLPQCVSTKALDARKVEKHISELTSVTGAAFDDAAAVDLLPREIKHKRFESMEMTALRLMAITIAAALLFAFAYVRFQARDYSERVRSAQQRLRVLEKVRDLKQDIDDKEALIHLAREDRIPVQGVFKLISAAIPPEIALTQLTVNQGKNKVLFDVIVSGNQDDIESVLVKFIERLEESLFFAEVTLVSSKKGTKFHECEITCDLVR